MKRVAHWVALVAVSGALGAASGVWAQYNPKQDAKDFANSGLLTGAKENSQSVPTTDLPEYYTDSPPQVSLGDNPSNLDAAGHAAKGSHDGYNSMLQSQVSRAEFDPDDLVATLAPGKEVAENPSAYTSGMSVNGNEGTCVELPQTVVSPGTYEQSCNTGTSGGTVEVQQSCNIAISVSTTTQQDIFASGTTNSTFSGNPNCSVIMGPYPQGQNFTYLGLTYHSTNGQARVYRCTGTNYVDFSPHPVYATTNIAVLPPVEDASQCAAIQADATCTLDAEVCTDSSPQTRVVNGVSFTLPCWAKRRDYTCTTGTPIITTTDCGELEELGCSYDREQCLTDDVPCKTVEEVWKCPLPPVPTGEKKFICDGDVYCIDGSCETIEREANDEFKDAVVALNAVAQARTEFNEDDWTIFAGGAHACTKLVFGIKNCCVPRGIPLMGGCNGEDTTLKTKREEGVCTYVGSWCSSSVLGVCLEKKERHCCYASKISRVIQEQGRKQLGKAWADPEDEVCAGFTIAEFQTLDLSQMDFSEVYADFVEAAKLPNELEVLDDIKNKIQVYYDVNG